MNTGKKCWWPHKQCKKRLCTYSIVCRQLPMVITAGTENPTTARIRQNGLNRWKQTVWHADNLIGMRKSVINNWSALTNCVLGQLIGACTVTTSEEVCWRWKRLQRLTTNFEPTLRNMGFRPTWLPTVIPSFAAENFRVLETWCFGHQITNPWHRQSNSKAERAVKHARR